MKPKWQEDSSCVFAYRFYRGTCQSRDTAGKERAPKSIRRRSGKRSFVKAVGTMRQENRSGRGKLPPCMPQSECGAGHTGYRASPDPSPGGSQDTGGAFRSRVQRLGVRGCSHEQRTKPPYRTGQAHYLPWTATYLRRRKVYISRQRRHDAFGRPFHRLPPAGT